MRHSFGTVHFANLVNALGLVFKHVLLEREFLLLLRVLGKSLLFKKLLLGSSSRLEVTSEGILGICSSLDIVVSSPLKFLGGVLKLNHGILELLEADLRLFKIWGESINFLLNTQLLIFVLGALQVQVQLVELLGLGRYLLGSLGSRSSIDLLLLLELSGNLGLLSLHVEVSNLIRLRLGVRFGTLAEISFLNEGSNFSLRHVELLTHFLDRCGSSLGTQCLGPTNLLFLETCLESGHLGVSRLASTSKELLAKATLELVLKSTHLDLGLATLFELGLLVIGGSSFDSFGMTLGLFVHLLEVPC